MYIPILIESLSDGRFRASAGEPFAMAAEGESSAAATRALERMVAERLTHGAQIGLLHVPNGSVTVPAALVAEEHSQTYPSITELQQASAENPRDEVAVDLSQSPLRFDLLPDDDWFFQGLREAIAENRRLEDEADP